ncbi:Cytochrome b561-like protein 2 [Hartmannibacter diazotrophicus]|uniref:Cytochrome b561-like protein 2 n=1 Tax=Hartmannibacter diazotrophicus TaxID=1482074 RepID=A0A2C9D3U5_9HYPH|nr:cytochrome b [Hartmannibacter diazotrophicus]SON54997.1 Cytochrome b561-like protein 2 [Hartmannibacter diazotrophicus]
MIRNGQATYGWGSILLHWSIALLFLLQLALGVVMTRVGNDPGLQFNLYQWHKSFGFLILLLAAVRLLWVLANPAPRPLGTEDWREILLARLVKIALLLLTLAIPLLGWAVVSASPLRIPSYPFDLVVIPNLPVTPSDALEHFLARWHALLAYGTTAIVVLHVAAALRHHFLLRDGTLVRMLVSRMGR